MRFRILVIFILIVCFGYAAPPVGNLRVAKVFADLPHDVLDLLRPSTRLDMLDYYNQADSILSATDALGGKSRLVNVTDDYLKVEVTPTSSLEIKILPLSKKESIIMTLYTVGGDGVAKDTDIRFFDWNYSELPSDVYIKSLELKDFFQLKGSDIKLSELKEKVPFTTIEYTTGPGNEPLKASFTALETLSDELKERLSPFLSEPLTFQWNRKFFKPGK